jgi:Large ribosomal RNA subunit accumulation protein YceD
MSGNKGLKNMDEASAWSVPVEAAEVPESGLHLELEANDTARSAIAKLAGVTGIRKLHASFDVARRGAGLHVIGRVTGEVGQTCVVTLEPLTNTIDEDVDLTFRPGASEPLAGGDTDEDAPEPLLDGRIDLGAIATEFLVLGVDPYPRKEGATFDAPATNDDTHPFAALAALKKDPGERS